MRTKIRIYGGDKDVSIRNILHEGRVVSLVFWGVLIKGQKVYLRVQR